VVSSSWGWQDGETPAYGVCVSCGQTLRFDRLDLLVEHMERCSE
jgi:hypothetical protein